MRYFLAVVTEDYAGSNRGSRAREARKDCYSLGAADDESVEPADVTALGMRGVHEGGAGAGEIGKAEENCGNNQADADNGEVAFKKFFNILLEKCADNADRNA